MGVIVTKGWQYMDLPTLAPTLQPTKFPSRTPTDNPTDNPSNHPTKNPTEISTMPTKMPSKPPYPFSTITSTITATYDAQSGEVIETMNRRNHQNKDGKLSSTMNSITVTIIIVSIFVCCFIMIMIFMLYSKRCKQQHTVEKEMKKHMEMPQMSTNSNCSHLPSPNKSVNHNIQNDIDITETSIVTPGLNPTNSKNQGNVAIVDQITSEGDYVDANGDDLIITRVNTNNSVVANDNNMMVQNDVTNNGTKTKNHNNDNTEVRSWMEEIGFGHYTGKFIVNGYHSLGMIRNIDSHQQLIEIGINSIQDRNRFMYW
eukprot:65427_1